MGLNGSSLVFFFLFVINPFQSLLASVITFNSLFSVNCDFTKTRIPLQDSEKRGSIG